MSDLTVFELRVRLGDKAVLQGVSAKFQRGKVTAIIGPNGAGKSTLLQCMAGLRAPGQGTVHLGDKQLALLTPRLRAQRIGFLPQIPEVAWAVDARTLVGLGRTPFTGARGLSDDDNAAVYRALALTNTTALADRQVISLSGGERSRVFIARALAGEPEWLLADEPLTGLDPGYQIDAAELFRKLAHQQGCGVVISLHDLHMALRIADVVIVLVAGRVIAEGPPALAISPATLAKAYGIRANLVSGEHGPLVDVTGRSANQ